MGKPAQVKRQVANLKHISAPLKGLSLSSKLIQGDPLTAIVLDNFVIEENQIRCRAGTVLRHADLAAKPIETMVPYYGFPSKMAAATNGTLILLDGTLVHSGFTANDWSWTSFSNLSSIDYTVMVNGHDGVWSWDGTTMVKETVTAPATETWITPDQFNIVMAYQNRLWFADTSNLAVYYLPIQTKAGAVALLPLNAVFKRGGTIRAMYTWTTQRPAGDIFLQRRTGALWRRRSDEPSRFWPPGRVPLRRADVEAQRRQLRRRIVCADLDRPGADVDLDAGRERAAGPGRSQRLLGFLRHRAAPP
jgi:hypothetical protein